MVPPPASPDHLAWEEDRDRDPVVHRYRAFFALFDWSQVPERDPARPWPGTRPHPTAAYVKALPVKLCEGRPYVTQLRAFLVEHPLLVLELGFRPAVDPTQPFGFDVERTVPCDRWLRHRQRTLDPTLLARLLAATVRALRAEVPGLGATLAIDVKHIYAWVQENNPKAYLTERYDPKRQPPGDPDCRLGIKRRSNRAEAGGAAKGGTEYLWGYGTGVASATDPRYGDVVLAEWTQPFNAHDVTYFRPLVAQAEANLGFRPPNLAADAAFDAWYVYHPFAERGGLAAIPLNARGEPPPVCDEQGRPLCARGKPMVPTYRFAHEDGYPAQRYGCPLLVPRPTGEACDHAQFAKGVGCVKTRNVAAGGRMRVELDRRGAPYRAVYRQRTSAERINSQATALGIERPKARNIDSVRRLNTLTYLVINARALERARAVNAAHAPRPSLC